MAKKVTCEYCGGEGECHTSHSWTCPTCKGIGYLINGQKFERPRGSDKYYEKAFSRWKRTGKNTPDSPEYIKEQKIRDAERKETEWLFEAGKRAMPILQKQLKKMNIPSTLDSSGYLMIHPLTYAEAQGLKGVEPKKIEPLNDDFYMGG